jgi:hypothetical protein
MNQMLDRALGASAPAAPTRVAVRGPIRLTRPRRVSLYAIALTAWLSGAAWLAFHYFVRAEGQFGETPSPLEPWWLRLHGAAAFAALWAFGLLWGVHILNGWRLNRRRWSGAILFGASAFLVASGYLLYYAGSEGLRDWISVAHWGVGLAAPLAFVWHRFLAKAR